MNGKVKKFAELSKIFHQCTKKNRENLIRTAQSLLRTQHVSEAMIAANIIKNSLEPKPERSEL